ncbi:hypothetical protein ACFFJT_14695 [Dyella flava]|uniref:DUF1579 domain-containing protein n=1 Tax=Dyella flava TaxID=1920170 RepID=A0ABS2JZZ5_9GAMM|nr:hypothetical protein [Dyella flava]MBM7124063.1 hypothetical protein [Dyella flava]GLQ50927.1 hypothetical protein GCM10010872_23760 [Dyella flava]
MRVSKNFLKAVVALCAALLMVLPASAKVQDASSPHDELAAWAGHWKIRIATRETQFGHAKTQDFDAKCAFLPHGSFMACEYLSVQPDPDAGHVINDVAILYYSDVGKTFKYTNVAPEGGPREDLMHVDGKVWTRPYEIPADNGGVIDAREIYTFASPDKQLARLEVSTDKGAHWTVVNEAVGTKEP